jgi:NADPH2:quinone reductase
MGAPTVFGVHPESQGEILRAAAKLVEAGQLTPHVSRVLKLEEIADGHRLIEDGHVTGKLVVQVKD